MRALSLIAICSVLQACWSGSSSSDATAQADATVTTNAAGVKSMELTAPWKDMNLSSIEGGVVVDSRKDSVLVRFPATPADARGGLFEVLKGEIVAAGWALREEVRDEDDLEGAFRTPSGAEASLLVNLHGGRPQARLSVLD